MDPAWLDAPTVPGSGRRVRKSRHLASLVFLWLGVALCAVAAWLGLQGHDLVGRFWPLVLLLAFGLFAWAWILEALADTSEPKS